MDWNEVFKRYGYLLLAGIIVLGAIVIFAFKSDEPREQDREEQTAQQDSNNESKEQNQNQNGSEQEQATSQGNLSAVGTLLDSDDESRGNYVLDSDKGRIYIFTSRDYSNLVGKRVTMNAEGTYNSFVFLGFNEGQVAGRQNNPPPVASNNDTDTTARGGASDEEGSVQVRGTLRNSDNANKGNYVIQSNAGKIYLQSVHDYSAWVGSNVELTAEGSIQSFTGATLKKV